MFSSSSTTRMLAAMAPGTWCWWPDSNGRPTDYESVALPAELHQRLGIEEYTLGGRRGRRRDKGHAAMPRMRRLPPPVAFALSPSCRVRSIQPKKKGTHAQHRLHSHRAPD